MYDFFLSVLSGMHGLLQSQMVSSCSCLGARPHRYSMEFWERYNQLRKTESALRVRSFSELFIIGLHCKWYKTWYQLEEFYLFNCKELKGK